MRAHANRHALPLRAARGTSHRMGCRVTVGLPDPYLRHSPLRVLPINVGKSRMWGKGFRQRLAGDQSAGRPGLQVLEQRADGSGWRSPDILVVSRVTICAGSYQIT